MKMKVVWSETDFLECSEKDFNIHLGKSAIDAYMDTLYDMLGWDMVCF